MKEIKIAVTKKGTYRTVSSIPFELECLICLKQIKKKKKTGYLVLVVNNSILVRAESIKS